MAVDAVARHPGQGQSRVQGPVHQHRPPRPGVGQEAPDPAVLDAPRRPAVLARHPGRVRPLLQEAGLVDDAHPGPVGQMVDDIGTQRVPASCQLFLRDAVLSRPSMYASARRYVRR